MTSFVLVHGGAHAASARADILKSRGLGSGTVEALTRA